jgi:ATP-binding cassette subfamily C protein
LGVAFVLSWQLALLFLLSGLTLITLMESRILKGRRPEITLSRQSETVHEIVHQHLGTIKLIKSSSLEKESESTFEKAVHQLMNVDYQNTLLGYRLSAIFDPLMIVILCVGFYCAVVPLQIPKAKAMVILFIFFRLAARLSGTRDLGHAILLYGPSYAAILADIQEAKKNIEQIPDIQRSPVPALTQGIALERVSFSYKKDKPVIQDLSLSFIANKTTALVGKSGSGKSTILDLIVGLLTPTTGRISIDQLPMSQMDLQHWREKIGYVSQETMLFHDSVFNNVHWANRGATREDVWHAIRMAQAEDFVSALPQSIDTMIGHQGIQLSGGERQRLALARALVRHPDLLILDEATSALDAFSEKSVQEAIDRLQNRMTIIIVTHRLATVRHADLIYVLDHGQMAESGNWDTLTRSNGVFHQLWRVQTPV